MDRRKLRETEFAIQLFSAGRQEHANTTWKMIMGEENLCCDNRPAEKLFQHTADSSEEQCGAHSASLPQTFIEKPPSMVNSPWDRKLESITI